MANIQLYILNKLVDIEDESLITLQKEFENEDELIVTEIEFSYSIELPATMNNRRIFGFVGTFDVPNKFSRIYDAELYCDDVLILKGKFRLSEIDNDSFKGNLYNPASQTVSDILGDKNLNEIIPHMKPMNNMQDMMQQNNYVMNLPTTDIPSQEYRDRHICYPYVLYTLPYNDANKAIIEENLDNYTQNLEYGTHTMTNDNIFPSFNVTSVIKDMFNTFGYNVIGNIFGDDKFKDLYQTFQYNYQDYLDKKEIPYYLKFKCYYGNYAYNKVSSTMEQVTLWQENETRYGQAYWNGKFMYGADVPLQAEVENSLYKIYNNDYHMLAEGENTNGKIIIIPKSGWYRIHVDGSMIYPDKSGNIYPSNDPAISGCKSNRDDCTLKKMPFEFQLKKGLPLESPKLYSFNSFIPTMPTIFDNDISVWKNDDNFVGLQCQDKSQQRRYGKNEKQILIKNYSDFDISDFVCGVRLGGGGFSWSDYKTFSDEGERNFQAKYKSTIKGVGLNLPNVNKTPQIIEHDDINYFNVGREYDTEEKTAQVMIRDDSYSNFEGYNTVDFGNLRWDTTSNVGQRSYAGANNSSASTTNDNEGNWEIDTTVWLEEGDTLYVELLMPLMAYGGTKKSTGHHTGWLGEENYVVNTMCDFTIEMGLVNSDKKWIPTQTDPIKSFEQIQKKKETNVNQFLPSIKCNDYLNNFLQTFNLRLTMPYKNTFSIDYCQFNSISGEVISLEPYANVKDAEFKALDIPSVRQLAFKIDKEETGYADGNQSPYRTEDYPWYEKGYDGGLTLTNEANTSGSIDKKESLWSYSWYKDIKFLNGRGLSVSEAPINVLSSKEKWSEDYGYGSAQSDQLDTNKTMRFFFLSKDFLTSMYRYIEFKYDEQNGNDLYTRLVIPSNYIETVNASLLTKYIIDYSTEPDDRTITDIFFNIHLQSGYEITVPVILPNKVYNDIKAGTLIKFNDGYYRVLKIEGHDISMGNTSTLSLTTLK